MKIVKQLKLLPTKEQTQLLVNTGKEYISLINNLVDYWLGQGKLCKFSSKTIYAELPSAIKNQAIQDARSVYIKACKTHILPELKKPVIIVNNQNYQIGPDFVSFPVLINGKSKRIKVKAIVPDPLFFSQVKLGTLRITKKNKKWIAQVAHEAIEPAPVNSANTMGVDLGILCPAVAVTSTGKVKFFGNGRQNKYIRRYHKKRRQKLGKAKKLNAIRKSENKEQRWMRDIDHKISRAIIQFAQRNHVSTIKLETLTGIRQSTKQSRKNAKNIHTWSFYRLQEFIKYKAKLAGITVVEINPAYTSQRCPVCGNLHKTNTRKYVCPKCHFVGHRDIVGARNILVT